MKQSEKERLLNNAYKKKVENLKFDLFQIDFLSISKGFFPFGIQYTKIKYTKYIRIEFIFMNMVIITNLKILKNAKD